MSTPDYSFLDLFCLRDLLTLYVISSLIEPLTILKFLFPSLIRTLSLTKLLILIALLGLIELLAYLLSADSY